MAKTLQSGIAEIKELLGTDKLVLGATQVLKSLKQGKVVKVYLSANCAAGVKKDVQSYAEMNSVEVITLAEPNDELGAICKKGFSISVLGVVQ